MPTELQRVMLEVRSAEACGALAEWMAWMDVGEVFLPGSDERLTAVELHARAKKLHAGTRAAAKKVGIDAGRVDSNLKRVNVGCKESAALMIEFVEMLGWVAGVRSAPPPPDGRTEAGFSLALHVVWRGGLPDQKAKPRTHAELIKARATLAAWWWRSRVAWYAANYDRLAPAIKKGAASVIKARDTFVKLVAAKKSAKVVAGDLELSTGGPLQNNYFMPLRLELQGLHRPRHKALQFAETGREDGPEATLASLWEEATGKPAAANDWPTTPI